MASIVLDSLTLDFPIYGSSHQSLRQALLARTGGLIRREGARQQRVLVRALEDVSLSLGNGDRLGVMGHNGAGKSTLLRVLAGVYAPTSGFIRVEGRISPLFTAAPGLDLEDTGYENIKTCGMFLGMSQSDIEQKIPEIAEFSELGDYLNLPVRTYSAGMLTRLGFAIATSINPDVLLLDEELGTGDARFAARAEERMQRLVTRSSVVVLATHSDQMLRGMCNRAILMEKGHIVGSGSAEDIIGLYHDREAAKLAGGSVNSG